MKIREVKDYYVQKMYLEKCYSCLVENSFSYLKSDPDDTFNKYFQIYFSWDINYIYNLTITKSMSSPTTEFRSAVKQIPLKNST